MKKKNEKTQLVFELGSPITFPVLIIVTTPGKREKKAT